MNPQQTNSPIPGVMVGINHTRDLQPIIREPKVLKVGIGIPKGRACYIYTFRGRWIVRYGAWTKEPKFIMETAKDAEGKSGFATRQEAEQWYAANKNNFADPGYPQRLPFFVFTKKTTIEEKGKITESFEPDFDAIEAHGDVPRELDIVFMGENPLFQEFQAWSATELKCHGDGLNALRVIGMGGEKWPGWKEAKAANSKYFPVYGDCFSQGFCPYAQEGGRDKLVCKPMTTLSFQLANSIRLGSTAYFTSTGIASAKSLFSSLDVIRSLAHRIGAGITNTPLKMVLRPFKSSHGGVQQSVSLEFRASDAQTMRKLLLESAWKPGGEPKMLAAPEDEIIQTAETVTAEFYPEAEPDTDDGAGPSSEPEKPSAQVATENKTDALAARISQEREKAAAVETPAPAPAPATNPLTIADYQAMNDVIEGGLTIDQKWRYRLVKNFLPGIGEGEFLAIIHSVTGGELPTVTAENSKRIWGLMEQAKTKDSLGAPSGEPGPEPLSEPAVAAGGQKKFF